MPTYVFPGQGSQQKGMGDHLFDKYKDLIVKTDAILGYSIKELCLYDPTNQLGQTKYTQTALFVVNALTYLDKIARTGLKPDFVAGHSLGEYNALLAAGAFDFETGLKLVKKRAELMSQTSGGGMAAVIGLTEGEVQHIIDRNHLVNIVISNYNTPTQFVISGRKNDIEKAESIFKKNKVEYFIPLKVDGAFHTSYMESAKEEFIQYIDNFKFDQLQIPVISNVYAREYKRSDLKETLAEQITRPVRWTESILYLMAKGQNDFEEIGPGSILSKLIMRIKSDSSFSIDVRSETKTRNNRIIPASLGSKDYRKDYGLKYAYVTGAMYCGIASCDLVVKMGKAGMMGFFGTGGLDQKTIEASIRHIQKELTNGEAYGMNLLCNPMRPQIEEDTVDLFLKYAVTNIEASAFMQMTPALVRYRLKGLRQKNNGDIMIKNRIQAKVSRPEVATSFLSPPPERVVNKLLANKKITQEQKELSRKVPMADDICVEADSGGHTDQGVAYTLMPAMLNLRDEMMEKHKYRKKIRIGAAGGIGTPEAALAAFMLGADFIVTGSINQCTVEAGTSDAVKNILQKINVQDTDYAPAGDMFELGAKVQVLRKGVFFPARANKLYELYRNLNSLDEIDPKTKKNIEEKYFERNIDEVYEETKDFFAKTAPEVIERAERDPKYKMALVFRWYFGKSTRLALAGEERQKVNFQVHCGPALGAFNQWVKGTELEDWKNRHVDKIAVRLMHATAELLNKRFKSFLSRSY